MRFRIAQVAASPPHVPVTEDGATTAFDATLGTRDATGTKDGGRLGPVPCLDALSVVRRRPNSWEHRYISTLALLDMCAGGLAGAIAYVTRFPPVTQVKGGYLALSLSMPALWVLTLALASAYDRRRVCVGPDEFLSVVLALAGSTCAIAVLSYASHAEVARGYLVLALPTAASLSAVSRIGARVALRRARHRGRCLQRVLVLGGENPVRDLIREVRRDPATGMEITAACLTSDSASSDSVRQLVPVLGDELDAARVATMVGAEAVVVVASSWMDARRQRLLSWELQRIGVDLIVVPGLIDVAGSRIHVTRIAGLPSLHVEEPQLVGVKRIAKASSDRLIALLALIVLAPLFAVIALAIRLDSPGPTLFKQRRIGQGGSTFTLYKFRSMRDGAEHELMDLLPRNEGSGPLFKLRADPRLTRSGGFLRRHSLDELPQLFNVLRGDMSIVGPRPALASEVAEYGTDIRRRLLVKPGLTGLWQVSGRSDLSWEESVRLDLRYVENLSLALDLAILWRTARVVIGGAGAY